jgi:hypothetical protein
MSVFRGIACFSIKLELSSRLINPDDQLNLVVYITLLTVYI